MKISIIGSGWLARPLALSLQRAGHELLLTTTQVKKVIELKALGLSAITYQLGDQLSNPEQLFDTQVLIIAITHKDWVDFDILMDQISEQNCQHILYISSTSVYQNNGANQDENSQQLNQSSPILAIEQLIQHHPSTCILRFAGLVGPGRHPGRFLTKNNTMKSPDAAVNLIHLEDCIGIIHAIIEQQAWQQVFNACADTHPKKLTFYQHMAKSLGNPDVVADFESVSTDKIIIAEKVKSNLNYHFKYPNVMTMEF